MFFKRNRIGYFQYGQNIPGFSVLKFYAPNQYRREKCGSVFVRADATFSAERV